MSLIWVCYKILVPSFSLYTDSVLAKNIEPCQLMFRAKNSSYQKISLQKCHWKFLAWKMSPVQKCLFVQKWPCIQKSCRAKVSTCAKMSHRAKVILRAKVTLLAKESPRAKESLCKSVTSCKSYARAKVSLVQKWPVSCSVTLFIKQHSAFVKQENYHLN